MEAFITWDTWRKIGPDARADLEAYWWNSRHAPDFTGIVFEIERYRADELVQSYGHAITDDSK